jgi:hypothetical protein
MATTQWLDIEEGKDFIALEELEGRDITYKSETSVMPLDRLQLMTFGAHARCASRRVGWMGIHLPLMILQKIQAADDIMGGLVSRRAENRNTVEAVVGR